MSIAMFLRFIYSLSGWGLIGCCLFLPLKILNPGNVVIAESLEISSYLFLGPFVVMMLWATIEYVIGFKTPRDGKSESDDRV